ncbi:MAG: metallophosphoesterase family protein, partial [Flavitalea sp.]
MSNSLARRKFMKLLSGTGALTFAGLSFPNLVKAAENTPEEIKFAFQTKPYLQNPGKDAITITWLTNKPAHSWIEYWPEGSSQKKSETIASGLVMANNTLNKIRVENLEPGKKYSYKILSKEIITFEAYKKVFGETLISDEFQFETLNPLKETMSMLIFNDIHDRPHSFGELEKLNGNDPYDMVFLNGDMFDYQTNEQQLVDHLINPCSEIFASEKPFLFIRGNHETRGPFAYQLENYFENIGKMPYFSFTNGPVFFVALDTGEDKPDDDPAYYGLAAFDPFREKQALWLDQQLKSPEAKKASYRVILMHIPTFHSGDWHGTMHCRKVFAPVFEKHKVDLVISGHTHKYGVHPPSAEHKFPIVIG